MSAKAKKITVIGCGVIGLSSGIRLLEAGFAVRIIAKDLPPNTTSDTAGAIWYPYRCFPEEKALEWGRQTLQRYYELANDPETGVFPVTFTEYLPGKYPDPWWKSAVRNFTRVNPSGLPSFYIDGYRFEVPFVDTSVYMPWLMKNFKQLGGEIFQKELTTIAEAGSKSGLVINCSGIGAQKLSDDPELFPVKGQAIRIIGENNGGFYLDQHGELALSYVLPRKNDIVLGGTAAENDGRLKPEEQVTEQILQNAKKLDPSLKITEITGVVAGLRPARHEVRLELEKTDNTTIIHNYGHGGAGFTLSWGCADEVVELVLNNVA